MQANNYAKAREIAAWKAGVAAKWDEIEVCEVKVPDAMLYTPQVGCTYPVEVTIDHKGLGNCIGVELVASPADSATNTNEMKLHSVQELKVVNIEGTRVTYRINNIIDKAGAFRFTFRMFPKNDALPHRQDFAYVRWF